MHAGRPKRYTGPLNEEELFLRAQIRELRWLGYNSKEVADYLHENLKRVNNHYMVISAEEWYTEHYAIHGIS